MHLCNTISPKTELKSRKTYLQKVEKRSLVVVKMTTTSLRLHSDKNTQLLKSYPFQDTYHRIPDHLIAVNTKLALDMQTSLQDKHHWLDMVLILYYQDNHYCCHNHSQHWLYLAWRPQDKLWSVFRLHIQLHDLKNNRIFATTSD